MMIAASMPAFFDAEYISSDARQRRHHDLFDSLDFISHSRPLASISQASIPSLLYFRDIAKALILRFAFISGDFQEDATGAIASHDWYYVCFLLFYKNGLLIDDRYIAFLFAISRAYREIWWRLERGKLTYQNF